MAQLLSNEEINKIQRSVDIVEVIGSYINLEKKGKNYFGVCPFHDDHTPSLSVSREKGLYSCFTCGHTGTVFKFVEDFENVSFIEAVKIVADKAGIKLDLDFKENSKYESMYEAYDLAIKFYQNNLKSKQGHAAHEYLNKRGLSDEIIDEFEIGYASPDSDTLTKLLRAKEFDEEEMINAGLINRGNSVYDLFRDRITFPIHNAQGKPVAFSARIYEKKDNEAKYINTKETPIFKKGEILFNYHRARNEARKLKQLIIVEGQMDAIRVYASGIKNVVATMGTALTDYHIRLLSKLNVEIILCLDNDSAGEKATFAIADMLENANIDFRILRLVGEKDPDEYIIAHGVDAYKDAINHAVSYFDFKKKIYSKNKDFKNEVDVTNYINSMLEELSKKDDDVLIEATINNLSEEFSISKATLIKKLNSFEKKTPVKKKTPVINQKEKKERLNYEDSLSELLIYYMISDVKYIKLYEQELSYLNNEKYYSIASDILAFYLKYNYINMADFIVNERDSEYLDDIIRIVDSNYNLELVDNDFVGLIEKLKEISVVNEVDKKLTDISNSTDINEQMNLLNKLMDIKKKEV